MWLQLAQKNKQKRLVHKRAGKLLKSSNMIDGGSPELSKTHLICVSGEELTKNSKNPQVHDFRKTKRSDHSQGEKSTKLRLGELPLMCEQKPKRVNYLAGNDKRA